MPILESIPELAFRNKTNADLHGPATASSSRLAAWSKSVGIGVEADTAQVRTQSPEEP